MNVFDEYFNGIGIVVKILFIDMFDKFSVWNYFFRVMYEIGDYFIFEGGEVNCLFLLYYFGSVCI